MYGLRKIHKNGMHYCFRWPLEIGATAKCPDWNPEPICGGGLHMLPEAIGNYFLLEGDYWCVVEFDEEKMVRIDEDKAKVPECKIVYLSESPDGLKDFFDLDKLDSRMAFYWMSDINGNDDVRDKITNSEYAYAWARNVTYYYSNIYDPKKEQDVMRDRITDSCYAYLWACNIGDKEIMRDRITDPLYAFCWARDIGDRELMRDRITDSEYAYHWATRFGDVEVMRDRVTNPYWKQRFNDEFGETKCTD